jgi:hypothetical protein
MTDRISSNPSGQIANSSRATAAIARFWLLTLAAFLTVIFYLFICWATSRIALHGLLRADPFRTLYVEAIVAQPSAVSKGLIAGESASADVTPPCAPPGSTWCRFIPRAADALRLSDPRLLDAGWNELRNAYQPYSDGSGGSRSPAADNGSPSVKRIAGRRAPCTNSGICFLSRWNRIQISEDKLARFLLKGSSRSSRELALELVQDHGLPRLDSGLVANITPAELAYVTGHIDAIRLSDEALAGRFWRDLFVGWIQFLILLLTVYGSFLIWHARRAVATQTLSPQWGLKTTNQIQFVRGAIVTLGFLGTVLGMFMAMPGVARIFGVVGVDQITTVTQMSASLGVAFATTLVAFFGTLWLNFLYLLLQQKALNRDIELKD